MNTKNIYAYTGPTPKIGYVGYINITQHDDGIRLIVRSEGQHAGLGCITLAPEQCKQVAAALIAHINGESTPPRKPLTDEEIKDAVLKDQSFVFSLMSMLRDDVQVGALVQAINGFARAIEAKLKEKNT